MIERARRGERTGGAGDGRWHPRRAPADVGVGVTGIAGPGGGTPEKPVGTVAIAAVTATSDARARFRFHGEREQVKFQASQAALDMVRKALHRACDEAVHGN